MAIRKKVEARFEASGNIGKKFSLWERAAARFGRNTEKSFKRANRAASRFSSNTKAIVAGLGISRGLGLIQQGLGSVVTQFIAFDKAALGATVRFKDIGPEAANFNEKLKEIEASARNAGATTQFTAAQAAEALDFLARAGFTSAEAMKSLESMINLSIATGEDFASVADKSSDLLGAFGLNADNTADKIANLNRLNDVLVKSANSANVTIETMFETMKTAAPIGKKIGVELEEVAALTAILGNAGIKGTEAGTALKNMFLRLSAATPATAKMLSAIGVTIDDGTGNMKKFSDIMEEVTGATKEFGNIKVAKVLDTLFGKRAIAGASNIGDAIAQVRDFENTLKNAGDTSKLTAKVLGRALENKLLVLSSTATEFGFKILEAFRGDAKVGIDSMAESIRNLDVSGFIEEIKGVIKILGALLKVAGFVAKTFDVIGSFIGESVARVQVGNELGGRKTFAEEQFGAQIAGAGSRKAPNRKEEAAVASQSSFKGQLNIAGAPAGSTLETQTSSDGFDVKLLGKN